MMNIVQSMTDISVLDLFKIPGHSTHRSLLRTVFKIPEDSVNNCILLVCCLTFFILFVWTF